MSIFDIFTSNSNQPVAPAPASVAPPAQGNIPEAPTVPAAAGQGVVPDVPAAPEVPAVPAVPDSPLDEFKDLWDTAPKSPETPPEIGHSAEVINKAIMNKADFTNSITPEHLAAIAEGGEAAQQAFAQAMNAVAKQSMAQAIQVSQKLNQEAISKAVDAERVSMENLVKTKLSSNHLQDADPLFSNPAVKPVMEATRSQLQLKFPNATPAELTDMTQNYIKAMAASVTPPGTPEVGNVNAGDATDWDAYMQAP